jgi:trans-AT polyketide synthase/acyltransferase/oxidoreductase domain-containing protein
MYIDLGPAGSLANVIKYNVKENSKSKSFQIMSPFQQELKKLEEIRKYRKENSKTVMATGSLKEERLLACIFPGQGSQRKGMGEGLFDRFPALTNQASEILGYSVKELCIQDPKKELNMTQYTQPALFVVNALSYLKWKEEEGIEPHFVAGHSLGEYNALFAAGAMDFATGVKLVQKRGALMAKMKEGGMVAVKGLSVEEINRVIKRNGLDRLDLANFNTYDQVVLSGPRELISRSGPFFDAAGVTMYFPLNVSGAFHSRYMLPAKEEFEQFLQGFDFSAIKIPIVSNVEASFYTDDKIKSLLASQLVNPVRWVESITFLLKQGEVKLKEIGPGDVLTKMVANIEKSLKEMV